MSALIESASPDDAEAVRAIYAFHVLNGTASFDTDSADLEFWRKKIAQVLGHGWPFVVYRADGQVRGYAYATQFRDRAA